MLSNFRIKITRPRAFGASVHKTVEGEKPKRRSWSTCAQVNLLRKKHRGQHTKDSDNASAERAVHVTKTDQTQTMPQPAAQKCYTQEIGLAGRQACGILFS